ncbi:MAG: glycosyltransferase family 4 protein [Veillonellaceae bacterium]|nr:glycosyltransferase family 4 protein [Veillonellaceae bacterium]
MSIPKTPHHCKLERQFVSEFGIYTCALASFFAKHTPEFAYFLAQHLKTADFVFLSHPYLVYELEQTDCHKAVIICDAHNVEFDLHQLILPAQANYLLTDIFQTEKTACQKARLITVCSQQDADRLAALYTLTPNKFQIVPNGADIRAIPFWDRNERQQHKILQNITVPAALFIGSDFPPNLEAVNNIVKFAKALPKVRFRIAGSICNKFSGHRLPANIDMLGIVSEQQKLSLFSAADLALNPIAYGSGTNIKMFEYMAAGLPIVTTPIGARGIDGADGIHFLVCSLEAIPDKINALLGDPAAADRISAQAYELIKHRFDWRQIAERLAAILNRW